jgi:hypothetical protein
MPKPHTFPTLFDEVKTVSISFLTKYRYLKPNQWQSGTINWSSNGNKTGSISIQVNTQSEQPYIELDYKCNEAPINYRVELVSAPSNLGKGGVWYFVCPRTGKRCRKLYLADTYFYHRSAFRGCMYEKQTQSKKSRFIDKTLGAYFRTDQLFEQLYKKHLKKQYAGKPTKKYLKLTQQIQKVESITFQEIEQAIS